MEVPQQQRHRNNSFARGKRAGNAKMHFNSRGGNFRIHREPKSRNTDSQNSVALNCIVDESALLAGLSNPDMLKKWVREGSINVYVPLYTLEKLNMLRSSPPPLNLNARKTLEWLDHITSVTENKTAGHVELQGPDDQYQTWAEVEKYLLPDTPLSSHNGPGTLDGVTETLSNSLYLSDTASPGIQSANVYGSETTSPDKSGSLSESLRAMEEQDSVTQQHKGEISHARGTSLSSTVSGYSVENGSGPDVDAFPASGTAGIPSPVRPLLNYVVWRTYNEDASIVGSGKYILLTDDPATRKRAQQFGVRAKLLSQVRSIVSRADNKRQNQAKSNGAPISTQPGSTPENDVASSVLVNDEIQGEEEDEVVFDPPRRPASNEPAAEVWDPDHFGREPVSGTGQKPVSSSSAAHVPSGPSAIRGLPRSTRGRGPSNSRGQAVAARGSPQHKLETPIDPDSYARPQPSVRRGRGGAARKLWDPNS